VACAAAAVALACYDEVVGANVAAARANRPHVLTALAEAGWTWDTAEAGFTVEARPPRPIGVDELGAIRGRGLFLLPAEVFGAPGGFRISLLAPAERLREALTAPGRDPRWCGGGLVVLTRTPGHGGKTRLAASVGREAADALEHAFLSDTLATAAASGAMVTVCYTPEDSWPALAACLPGGAAAMPQPGGDLGVRICAGLRAALDAGSRAILVGSDTPDLPIDLVDEAFGLLDTHDLVLGPAADGGFYLIGLRTVDEQLFQGVAWSTATVLAQTLANAAGLGLSVATLREWDDIDDDASLGRLAARLAAGETAAPATAAVLAGLAAEGR
jgi:rSAM/selenodomain-associated transferase 1